MSPIPSVEILVYPDDCDSFGHVNQATFFRLFEHSRWDAVARGPGMDLFSRHDAWPAVRKATIEYLAGAFAGDLLRFETSLTHIGNTSFSLHSTAVRVSDGCLVAEADFVFVCVARSGKPTMIPSELAQFLRPNEPIRPSLIQNVVIRGGETAVDLRGDGPVILFVHGFPLDRTMWRPLAGSLSGWRRAAPDLRGLGASPTRPSGYSMVEYAKDLAALLDSIGCDKAVVCGFSMGGYVAFEFLRMYASRVRGLILLNTRADEDTDEGKMRREEMIDLVKREGLKSFAESFIPKLLAPGSMFAMEHVVKRLRTMITDQNPEGVIGALRAMKERRDSTQLLSEIRVPTLVVSGKEDQLIPATCSQSMAAAIPGAQYTVISDAGHLTPMEQPVAAGRVVQEFLESLG